MSPAFFYGVTVGIVIGFITGALYIFSAVSTGRFLKRGSTAPPCLAEWLVGELSHICVYRDGHLGRHRCVCGTVYHD